MGEHVSVTREGLAVTQVTPYAWEDRHAVNSYVAGLSAELAGRGHAVTIIAPSHDQERVRETRQRLRSARAEGWTTRDESPTLLAVGEVLPLRTARAAPRLPIDVARTIEESLGVLAPDLVHVHEPFAPSASSAALRHSRALNVGSFHAPSERVLSTQLARRVVELFFGRLDARTASSHATRERVERYFPAAYRVILPGASAAPAAPRAPGDPVRVAFIVDEERAALRLFLRAIRRLPELVPWEVVVWSPDGAAPAGALRRELRDRIHIVGGDVAPDALLARSDLAVLASAGGAPAPGLLASALAAGAVPVVARLPEYEEVLGDAEASLLFEPGDGETLAEQLARLITQPDLRSRLRTAGEPRRAVLTWARVADEFEQVYGELVARRHDTVGRPDIRARLASRPIIDVDLHMHTDHSADCATPVEALLRAAREQGLGAIAITDHNEVSGALEARAKADGIKVIVGEEIKTANQGEVIGLFLEQRIPRGLTLDETIAEIRRQDGLVYVPHPFDRLHTVPDYEHLLAVLNEVDAIEVFNPRVAIASFNEEAVRFAGKYRIVAGAGSDAHVVQGLGSVRVRMRDFDGPLEFLESLRDADIVRKPANLLYVQALKFLQTKATPAPARRASRERRVRRAARAEAARNS